MFPNRAQHPGRVTTQREWALSLRTMAEAKLREAYQAIPHDLQAQYPGRRHRMPPDIVYSSTRPNSERQDINLRICKSYIAILSSTATPCLGAVTVIPLTPRSTTGPWRQLDDTWDLDSRGWSCYVVSV
jgi:hypothetical protein